MIHEHAMAENHLRGASPGGLLAKTSYTIGYKLECGKTAELDMMCVRKKVARIPKRRTRIRGGLEQRSKSKVMTNGETISNLGSFRTPL